MGSSIIFFLFSSFYQTKVTSFSYKETGDKLIKMWWQDLSPSANTQGFIQQRSEVIVVSTESLDDTFDKEISKKVPLRCTWTVMSIKFTSRAFSSPRSFVYILTVIRRKNLEDISKSFLCAFCKNAKVCIAVDICFTDKDILTCRFVISRISLKCTPNAFYYEWYCACNGKLWQNGWIENVGCLMHCLTITFSFITNEQTKCFASQFPFENEFLFQIFSELGIFCTNISTCQRVRTFHEKMTKTPIFTYFLLRKIFWLLLSKEISVCVWKNAQHMGLAPWFHFSFFSFSSPMTEAKSGFSLAEKMSIKFTSRTLSLLFWSLTRIMCIFHL